MGSCWIAFSSTHQLSGWLPRLPLCRWYEVRVTSGVLLFRRRRKGGRRHAAWLLLSRVITHAEGVVGRTRGDWCSISTFYPCIFSTLMCRRGTGASPDLRLF
jgi:hypothetical protein